MATEMEVKTKTDWQPIETAPKDGAEILLFEQTVSGPFYRVGYWEESGQNVHNGNEEEGWSLADEGYTGCIEPTHWMPLPDPSK